MNVKDLKALLSTLPENMEVVMFADDDFMATVCKEKSGTITIIPDERGMLEETVLLLLPCSCDSVPELGEINSQPELN